MATVVKMHSPLIIKKYDLPPHFSGEERKKFGYLPSAIQSVVDDLKTPHSKLGFIMQYFYFQSTGRFYPVELFYEKDCKALAKRYKLGVVDLTLYDSSTAMRHCAKICDLLGFQRINRAFRRKIQRKADELCEKQTRPRLIFEQLVEYLYVEKIEGLTYYPLAEIITKSLNRYQGQLVEKLTALLSDSEKEVLDTLLEKVDETEHSITWLTFLSKYSHSSTPSNIKGNCEKVKNLQEKLEALQKPIKELSLAPEAVDYYARMTLSYDIHQLSRRDNSRYLYLLSFIIHQSYLLQDILTETLIGICQKRKNKWIKEDKDQVYEAHKKNKGRISILSQTVDVQDNLIQTLFTIAEDEMLTDREKIALIKSKKEITLSPEVSEIVEVEVKKELGKKLYEIEEEDSNYLQRRASNILKILTVDKESSDGNLCEALFYFQQRDGDVIKNAPTAFLEPDQRESILRSDNTFRKSLYKTFLFLAVTKGIKSGILNLKDSYKFRSFESYLIPLERWVKDQEQLIEKAKLSHIFTPHKLLQTLEEKLNNQVKKTHISIIEKQNLYASYDKEDKLVLKKTPPKESEEEVNSLREYFPNHGTKSLFEILTTINEKVQFTDSLEHQSKKGAKKRASEKALLAGIIGYGCNIGIPRMGQMVKNLKKEELEYAIQKQFSIQNLHNANNAILNLMEGIPTAALYKKEQDQTHTSSDGQKVPVGVDSLYASYSYKYFGSQKGVSIYSFIDEGHKLFHSTVITPSEREAAYVIDGLMMNDVVESTIHSTDTHGYSEIVFAVTHLLGISFAPRIKGLKKLNLYGFTTPSEASVEAKKLLKGGRIKRELIEEQWENILRLIVTIKLKEETASQLFKRLSSYSNQHPLYRALKQFGRIVKSIFLLQYIDDLDLRQAIEKQLNKTESYHSFAKAIAFARNQELNYATRDEQMIAEGCKRLIANAIICWNYLYITKKYKLATDEEKREIKKAIQNGSMVIWQHINFQGEYDFSDTKLREALIFDLEELMEVQFE